MKSVENQETTKCMICGHQELKSDVAGPITSREIWKRWFSAWKRSYSGKSRRVLFRRLTVSETWIARRYSDNFGTPEHENGMCFWLQVFSNGQSSLESSVLPSASFQVIKKVLDSSKVCRISLESYSYRANQLNLIWAEDTAFEERDTCGLTCRLTCRRVA